MHTGSNSIRSFLAIFSWTAASLALRAAGGPAPEAARALPEVPSGATPVIDEARTHDGITTWDLGPAPGEPGKHRYAVAIPAGGAAPEVTVRGRLGEAPLRIRLADGRRIEWEWKLAAPVAVEARDELVGSGPDAPGAPTAPAGRLSLRRGKFGVGFHLDPGAERVTTRLTLPAEMSALWTPSEPGGALRFLSNGYPVATVALDLGGGRAELRADGDAGEYEFILAPGVATALARAAGPAGIDGYISPGAGARGQLSRNNAADPSSGGAFNGSGNVGSNNNSFNVVWWMRSYLQWSLAAIPANTTIQNAYLWPLKIASKTGAATTNLYIRDITYSTTLPFPAYSAAAFDDIFATRPGHDPYLDTTLSGADQAINLTIYSILGHQASQDLNASPRGGGADTFAIGFSSDAVTANPYSQYFNLDPTSVLWVYYNDYRHNQVVISALNPTGNNGQPRSIRLFNYGETIDISGWQISSVNHLGTAQSFTIPPVVAGGTRMLPRHEALTLFDTTDPSWGGSYRMITNGNYFAWDNIATGGGDPLQVTLTRAAGGAADYACFGGATPAAGSAWTGSCPPGPAGFTFYVRTRDSDTDSGADWDTISYFGSEQRNPGQIGSRRRSDVVINGVLAYGGPYKENEVELMNFGPPVDLQNWSLQFYDSAGTFHSYTLTGPTPVGTGERVWLVETNLFGTLGGYPAPDARHRNMNFLTGLGWDLAPRGGEVMLFDAGGKPRDYLVFGNRRPYLPYAYDYLNWIGGNVQIPFAQPVMERRGDLSAIANGDWTASQWNCAVNCPSWFTEPGWNPGQNIVNRVQDELGIQGPASNGGFAGAHGYGNRIVTSDMVGIERIAMPAELQVEAGTSARFVVKRVSPATLVYDSGPVAVPGPGVQVVTSPLISPPLPINNNEYYEILMYVNAPWRHFQATDQSSGSEAGWEYLSFGGPAGMDGEAGFAPTVAMSPVTTPTSSVHAWYSVIHAPSFTNPTANDGRSPPTYLLPDGELTVAYSFTHASGGGYGAARAWTVSVGSLPPGLTMSSAGVISGIPTLDGAYTFTVRVSDGAGLWREQPERLIVRPVLRVATSALPYYDNSGAPYGFQLQAFGGVSPLSWSCSGLPAGLACGASGLITGAVTAAVANGNYAITVQVSDANGLVASRVLTLAVYRTPAILTPSLANGYVGYDYGVQQLVAAGGAGAPNWTVTAGTLPPGLALAAATGRITGTPTAAGPYGFTITFGNAGGSASRGYTIAVGTPSAPNYWIRRGLAGADLDQLYYSPAFAQDGTVFAVTRASILLISRDGGFFWRRTGLNLEPRWGQSGASAVAPLRTLAFHPAFDGRPGIGNKTILINTAEQYPRLLRSDDLGATWTPVASVNPANFYCDDGPWFAPSGVLYCAGRANELPSTSSLYRSDASLTGWTALDATPIAEFYPSPTFATDQTLFARGRDNRLYRSTNAGAHWTDFGPLNAMAGRLEFSPDFAADKAVGYLSAPGGAANNFISLSLDNGYSFNAAGQAYNPVEFHFPPTYTAANPVLYAAGGVGAGAQLMVSGDNGVNFVPTGTGGMASVNFRGGFRISPTFASDRTLLAMGANGRALYRSQDAGVTWGPSENGLYLQAINTVQLAPDFAGSRTGFLGTDSGPYYTSNGGRVWRAARLAGPLPPVMQIRALAVSPAFATDRTVFAQACAPGAAACQLIRSSDGGKTYAGLATLASRSTTAYDLRVSPNYATDRILLYNARWGFSNGGKTSQFLRSTDGGTTFSPVFTFYYPGVLGFDVSPGFAQDGTVYQYMNSNGLIGTYSSTDGGATWAAAAGGWPVSSRGGPRLAPTFNRLSGTDGTPSHTVLSDAQKSVNAGTGFSPIHATMAGTTIFSPNYATDNTLFNHYTGNGWPVGLYKSADGGATGAQITPAGFPFAFTDARQIALSPAYANGGSDRTLFVATGSGLWTSGDGGATWTLSTGTESFSDQVTAAAQDPNRGGRLYLGSLDDGIAYSDDDGETTADLTLNLKSGATPFVIRSILAVDNPATPGTGDTALLASTSNGLYRMVVDANGVPAAGWSWYISGSTLRRLSTDGAWCYAANAGSFSYRAPLAGGCASWSAVALDSEEIGYSPLSGPTVPLTGPAPKGGGPAPSIAAGSPDAYWSAGGAGGAFHSADGVNWIAAPGGNDYALPATSGFTSASPMGVTGGAREVAIGHATLGVFLSRDGGDTWRNVSGPGSGLEATSKNASAFLAAATSYGSTDLLVGVNGASNGGVYLSGDGGQHWTQVNQGFDPNNLSISSLVKTSCAGCPVQYYSGTYGGGIYTRTIAINKPPFYDLAATWCAGAGCACGTGALGGPVQGGTPLKLCGSNFQSGMVVELDGVAASGCTLTLATSPQTMVCSTPPHAAGAALIRARNPDTRARQLSQTFLYTGDPLTSPSRSLNSLRMAKSAANAWLSWRCDPATPCTAPSPARVYRSQSAQFSVTAVNFNTGGPNYLEVFNGGPSGTVTGGCAPAAGNDSCYADAGTMAGNPRSYFWSVE